MAPRKKRTKKNTKYQPQKLKQIIPEENETQEEHQNNINSENVDKSDLPAEENPSQIQNIYHEVIEGEVHDGEKVPVSNTDVSASVHTNTMDCSENSEQVEETATDEISQQFSSLNFNAESILNRLFSTLEEEKDPELNYDSMQSDFIGEYVSDEAIPIVNEQEIECINDTDVVQHVDADNVEKQPKQKRTVKKPRNKTQKANKNKVVLKKKSVRVPKNKTKDVKNKSDSITNLENSIRRSSRIKSISVMKQQAVSIPKSISKSGRHRKSNTDSDTSETSYSGHVDSEKVTDLLVSSSEHESDYKPVKVKSRWRRCSELEMGNTVDNSVDAIQTQISAITGNQVSLSIDEEINNSLKQFVHMKENQYLTDRVICKEAKKMVCDCFLTPEDIERGELGCGEDCLNRLLLIECGALCPVNDRCTNKRFQKSQFSLCEVFRTDKKGLGIRAIALIPHGEFILEYIGEVIGPDEFEDRATEYSKEKNPHYYFMSLRSDAVIDATQKGNISRFINHSCEPNAETQKWTVNGELRIGFFSKRTILSGEEITFDYQFQRYGKEAQKCFCESAMCRGWLGEEPADEEDEEEEDMGEVKKEEETVVEAEVIQKEIVEEVEEPLVEPTTKDVINQPLIEAEVPSEIKEPETIPIIPVAAPVEAEIKKPVKKEKRKIMRMSLRDMFEDVDVGEEINMLAATGLKNQAHTLKLSRLMVRANEITQRSVLLRVLRHGEFSCRRLFLDYHGLRLIHGWMNDSQLHCKTDLKHESLRLELLQTLMILPIPNKTMLQDSKVLMTVELWSKKLDDLTCGLDSESNSPRIEMDSSTAEEEQKVEQDEQKVEQEETKIEKESDIEIRKSVGMDIENIRSKSDQLVFKSGQKLIQDIIDMFDEDALNNKVQSKIAGEIKQEKDLEVEIIALAQKLLEEWSALKEVFRIPKKERIEQMKEHEREANKGNYFEKKNMIRHRLSQSHRFNDKTDERARKNHRLDDRPNRLYKKINKHERRKLFAMQVEIEEGGRRYKNRDMWRQHDIQCMPMTPDPRFAPPFDPSRSYQCLWNQQTGQWQNFPLLNPNVRFTPPMPYSFNTMPPLPNMPPPLSVPNIPPPVTSLPLPITSVPPPLPNTPPVNHNLSLPPIHMPPPPIINHPPLPTSNATNVPPQSMEHLQIPLCIPSIPPPSTRPPLQLPNIQPQPLPIPNRSVSINQQQQHIPIPVLPQDKVEGFEIVEQVKFAGPIPPPVKLPPKWKCAKDKYGRPYYYHIKIRISQWEPPEFPEPVEIEEESSDSTSSSETSSLSSDSSSEDSDEDDLDDTKLLLEIRKKFQQMDTLTQPTATAQPQQETKSLSPDDSESSKSPEVPENNVGECSKSLSLDERLKEEFKLTKKEPTSKHKRSGLVTQIHLISPRTEEDKAAAKENLRKYKENKERLKRQKEVAVEQNKKRVKVTVKNPKPAKKHKSSTKIRLKDTMDLTSDRARKIKESFRSSMAGVMVGILNPYRKSDCKEGKITNTEDFKHLARKLTHFVMLKELKHCQNIEDLICTDSVKSKAKEFVRKYMSKFGEVYNRPKDDLDY